MEKKALNIPGGIQAVLADYKPQNNLDYKGNPLIEALPPILSEIEVLEMLEVYPDYDSRERCLETHDRLHCIQRLFRYFQPLTTHFDLEQRISALIRQGYVGRNPNNRETTAQLYMTHQQIKDRNLRIYSESINSTAGGLTLIGISGIGKTTTIQRVLSIYPQVIIHETPFNCYQITRIKLDCSNTLKGLCLNFFLEIDRLLGTNYQKYGSSRNSVESMLAYMVQVAKLHHLGVLVIDEVQHLKTSKSGGSESILNFFVTLVNTIGLPVILIGTMKAMSVLQSEFRQARRGSSGQGDMIWQRMERDEDWGLLVEGMWKYQWTKKEIPLTEEIMDVLYEESQGIIDIAVKLYVFAQRYAINSGKETVTPDTVLKAAKKSLNLVQPMIQALKSGDENAIRKYEDLLSAYDKGSLNSSPSSINLTELVRQKKAKQQDELTSKLEQVVVSLIKLEIEPKMAQKAAKEVLINADLSVSAAIKEAFKIALNVDKPISANDLVNTKKSKNKKKQIEMDQNDLRTIVQKGKEKSQSAYEALKESGYIKSPTSEFKI
jgi:hypothetical protein